MDKPTKVAMGELLLGTDEHRVQTARAMDAEIDFIEQNIIGSCKFLRESIDTVLAQKRVTKDWLKMWSVHTVETESVYKTLEKMLKEIDIEVVE